MLFYLMKYFICKWSWIQWLIPWWEVKTGQIKLKMPIKYCKTVMIKNGCKNWGETIRAVSNLLKWGKPPGNHQKKLSFIILAPPSWSILGPKAWARNVRANILVNSVQSVKGSKTTHKFRLPCEQTRTYTMYSKEEGHFLI